MLIIQQCRNNKVDIIVIYIYVCCVTDRIPSLVKLYMFSDNKLVFCLPHELCSSLIILYTPMQFDTQISWYSLQILRVLKFDISSPVTLWSESETVFSVQSLKPEFSITVHMHCQSRLDIPKLKLQVWCMSFIVTVIDWQNLFQESS